jgi:hypothetical protein
LNDKAQRADPIYRSFSSEKRIKGRSSDPIYFDGVNLTKQVIFFLQKRKNKTKQNE